MNWKKKKLDADKHTIQGFAVNLRIRSSLPTFL